MQKNIDRQKEELIAALVAARQHVLSVIHNLPAERLDAQCIGNWCAKDLLAHLIGWDYTNLKAIQEILAGQRPTFFQYYDKDWQSYNAKLVQTYRREPFSALIEDVAASHSRLVIFLQSLSADEVIHAKSPRELGRTITIRNLLRSEASDEHKHAEDLALHR